MPSLIGNKPNQVPSNGDLGRLAFMDNLDSFTSKTVMDTDITNIAPSLSLDFANSKVLDPRITFTRASTATFYNGISSAKAEENVILQSQAFDSANWVKTNSTVTANTSVAPDGTTTADKIIGNAGAANHKIHQGSLALTSGANFIFSVYAKKAEYDLFAISEEANFLFKATFDLTAGTVASSTGCTASIVDAGSGWYRCIISDTAAATQQIGFGGYPSGATVDYANISYTGDGTSGLLVWGAQLEQRSAATAYTPTTTAAVTNYIPTLSTAANGVARFDHNPITGESLGLLIEEQRVNLATYSDDFSNAAWTKNASGITVNSIVAPDGTLTGDLLLPTTDNSVHWARQNTASTAQTISVYAKAYGYTKIALKESGTTGAWASFDLSNATVLAQSSGTTSITFVGNGWYRLTFTLTAATANAGFQIVVVAPNYTTGDPNGSAFVANGYSGVFIWGAQLEAGSFATSYIPTVASQVTRSPDVASMTGTNFSSWFNNAEGSFYSESSSPNTATNDTPGFSNGIVNVSDNTLTNFIVLGISGATGYQVYRNSVLLVNITIGTPIANTVNKLSSYYSVNNFIFARNGALGTGVTTGIPPTVTQLNIGRAYPANGNITGYIKKISYYPRRLPNSELVEMTA